MAFNASPLVVALLLSTTFISNEAVSLSMERVQKMETQTGRMEKSLMRMEASAKAMEAVFKRSDEVHEKSMKKMMSDMSSDQALKVLHKMNRTNPALIQLADKALHQDKAGLRGQLHKRDPTTATNTGVNSIRDMMNTMIEESMAKYDVEVDRCTEFYSSQCFTMEAARGKIAGANAKAANARALISDAQSCINKCEEDIPDLKQELKDFKRKCLNEKTQLKKRQTLLEGDLATMGTILDLVDKSCTSFVQTGSQTAMLQGGDQNGQVEMCVDECGQHFLKVMHQEHRLKSSVGVKLLGEAMTDVMGGYGGAPSFLQLNMSVGNVDASAADSDDEDSTDPGKTNVASYSTPAPQTKVPASPCKMDPETGMWRPPQPANKRGAKCVMRGDCAPMKERFLQVRTNMEEEVDVIKQAIEDLTEHCEATETRLTRSVKTQEQLEDKCQTNLAQAQEKQNDAAKEADDTAAEFNDLHAELDKNMKSCHDNYMGYEGEICALKKIRGEVFKLKASGKTPFFADCQVGPWTAGDCSVPCGGGSLTLTRKIQSSPMNGAKCLPLTAVRSCNAFPCPIDCKKDVWEPWSACSADCGGGVQQRVRQLIVAPKYGGNPCGPMEQSRRCNERSCDEPCTLAEWTEWSDCSKGCDGGTSKRSRFVKLQATGTGKCADAWSPDRLQYKACNSEPCQVSTGMETMKCTAKLDIILLIDGSGSLGQAGWDAELLAAETMISAFEGANSQIQLSTILYSGPSTWSGVAKCLRTTHTPETYKTDCKVDIVKHFSSNIGEVKTAVKALQWPSGSTLTSVALNAAYNELTLGRPDAQSIVVCITDGRPLFWRNTWFASHYIRKKARLMWVPVTRFAPLAFIKYLATRRWQENIINVPTFDYLKENKAEITNHLIADICPKASIVN